jgi:hypothetical protein
MFVYRTIKEEGSCSFFNGRRGKMAQLEQEMANPEVREQGHHVPVIVRIVGHEAEAFEFSTRAMLLDLMAEGARLGGFALLPTKERPFDRLHRLQGKEVGPVIENLHQTLGEYLQHLPGEPHFAVELARSLRVNTRWDVAPKQELTPREILALPNIHLDPAEYSLYLPDCTEPLSPDRPVKIERGADFEAQRDGRYGREL